MLTFGPSWNQNWTIERAEKELFPHFKFGGPGWYECNGDFMLVVPFDDAWDDATRHPNVSFNFIVWNQQDPREAFNFLAYGCPVRDAAIMEQNLPL